jgi:Tol biopolymer transport system component
MDETGGEMRLKRLIISSMMIFVTAAVFYGEEKGVEPTPPPAGVVKLTSWSALDTGRGRTLWWVYRDGREEAVQAPPSLYFFPHISPDGNKISFTSEAGGDREVWILDTVQNTVRRLTFTEASDNQPIWSPDGKRIVFNSECALRVISQRGGIAGIVSMPADGSGEAELLGISPGKWLFPFSWDKDGKILVTSELGPSYDNFDIGMLSTEWDRPYEILFKEAYHEMQPQLSPDGRWLAYSTTEASVQGEVYVSPFPDVKAGKWKVSTGGGNSPRWSKDGKELYYLIGYNNAEAVMAVDVATGPNFKAGKPRVLFTGKYLGTFPNHGIPYDVHPDGQKFLMIKE